MMDQVRIQRSSFIIRNYLVELSTSLVIQNTRLKMVVLSLLMLYRIVEF